MELLFLTSYYPISYYKERLILLLRRSESDIDSGIGPYSTVDNWLFDQYYNSSPNTAFKDILKQYNVTHLGPTIIMSDELFSFIILTSG